jgi:hypothetical protein
MLNEITGQRKINTACSLLYVEYKEVCFMKVEIRMVVRGWIEYGEG